MRIPILGLTVALLLTLTGCDSRYEDVEHNNKLYILDTWTGELSLHKPPEVKESSSYKVMTASIVSEDVAILAETNYRGGQMYYQIQLSPVSTPEEPLKWRDKLRDKFRDTSSINVRFTDQHGFVVRTVSLNSFTGARIIGGLDGVLSLDGKMDLQQDEYLAISKLSPTWVL